VSPGDGLTAAAAVGCLHQVRAWFWGLDTLDHVRAGGILAGSVAPSLHRDC
jgi:hypothetical protein